MNHKLFNELKKIIRKSHDIRLYQFFDSKKNKKDFEIKMKLNEDREEVIVKSGRKGIILIIFED